MARRRVPEPVLPPGVREFTAAEVARIRELVATKDSIHAHPHPNIEALEAIHAAAGRRRGFMVWPLDPVRTQDDLDRAVAEELAGGIQ